jgi:hypothetical protein
MAYDEGFVLGVGRREKVKGKVQSGKYEEEE